MISYAFDVSILAIRLGKAPAGSGATVEFAQAAGLSSIDQQHFGIGKIPEQMKRSDKERMNTKKDLQAGLSNYHFNPTNPVISLPILYLIYYIIFTIIAQKF